MGGAQGAWIDMVVAKTAPKPHMEKLPFDSVFLGIGTRSGHFGECSLERRYIVIGRLQKATRCDSVARDV